MNHLSNSELRAQGLVFGPNSYPVIPGTTMSLLTDTSKMPSYSFSLPAKRACPGAKGSICDHCYADGRGRYGMPNVRDTQNARFAWVLKCLTTDDGVSEFVATMTLAIKWACRRRDTNVFRVHDSGDLFNARYARAWARIAAALPEVKFWFPTRMWHVTGATLIAVRELAALENVTVRPSALNVGDAAPVVDGFGNGATVKNAGAELDGNETWCPAYSSGTGKCGDCRKCWDADVTVVYPLH